MFNHKNKKTNASIFSEEYYQQIKKIIFNSSPKPEIVTFFKQFNNQLKDLLTLRIQPESELDKYPEQILHIFEKTCPQNHIRKVYASPASEHTLERIKELDKNLFKVIGFIDNFKTGTFNDLPVCKPDDIAEHTFENILILAKDDSLQGKLFDQLKAILPAAQHNKIILLGRIYSIEELTDLKKNIQKLIPPINKITTGKNSKDSIVIAVPKFPIQSLPMIGELRRQGYSVILIMFDQEFGYGEHLSIYEDYFDLICPCVDYLDLILLVSETDADILYTIDFACETHLCLLLRAVWKGKMFHEIYGMGSMLDILIEEDGCQQDIASSYQYLNVENQARSLLFNAVDGIIYRSNPYFETAFKKQYNTKTPLLHFEPYPDCNEKKSFSTGIPHIAWCGYHPGRGQSKTPYKLDFKGLIEDIVYQNIHFHSFNSFTGSVKSHDRIAQENPFLHLESPLSFEDLPLMLRCYDWGCMMFYFDKNDPRKLTYATSLASRFLTYISAELPILCSEEYTFMAETINKYKNGIVLAQKDIPNLKNILTTADMDFFNQNAISAKKDLNIQKQFNRLEDFLTMPH